MVYDEKTGVNQSLLITDFPLTRITDSRNQRIISFIKTNRRETDVFALTAPNKVTIFQQMTNEGYPFKVSVNTSEKDPIVDSQPYEDDKVISLCVSSMVIIHQYNNYSCTVLQYLSLVKILPKNIEFMKLCICSQDRYLSVISANVKRGSRDKLYLLEMDVNDMPTLIDVEEFEGEHDEGSLIVDLNMDVYKGDSPVIMLFELLNRGKVDFYNVLNSRLNKFDELDDVYEELLMMVKRRRGGGEFIGLDYTGNIYSSVWDQRQKGLHSPKKHKVPTSSSPQAKRYEGETLRLSFVPDMVGISSFGYSPSKSYYNNQEITPKINTSPFYINPTPNIERTQFRQPNFDEPSPAYHSRADKYKSNNQKYIDRKQDVYLNSNNDQIGVKFDSNKLYDPQESVDYNSTEKKFMKVETIQRHKIDPYLEGDYSNLVPMHTPKSPYNDWRNQPTKSPQKQLDYSYALKTKSDIQNRTPHTKPFSDLDESRYDQPSPVTQNFRPSKNYSPLVNSIDNPYEVKTNFELCNE